MGSLGLLESREEEKRVRKSKLEARAGCIFHPYNRLRLKGPASCLWGWQYDEETASALIKVTLVGAFLFHLPLL